VVYNLLSLRILIPWNFSGDFFCPQELVKLIKGFTPYFFSKLQTVNFAAHLTPDCIRETNIQ